MAQVARCFEDANVVHVENRVDPVADIATVTTELCLKDLETVTSAASARERLPRPTADRKARGRNSASALGQASRRGKPARTFALPDHADAAPS